MYDSHADLVKYQGECALVLLCPGGSSALAALHPEALCSAPLAVPCALPALLCSPKYGCSPGAT